MDGWMQSTPIEILHNDLTLHLFSNDNYPLHVQDSEKRKKKKLQHLDDNSMSKIYQLLYKKGNKYKYFINVSL